jgi:hypothetical protein
MWKYKIGTVVKYSSKFDFIPAERRWGHVTGFSRNPSGETILIVKWDDGKEYATHPGNIILEEDEE